MKCWAFSPVSALPDTATRATRQETGSTRGRVTDAGHVSLPVCANATRPDASVLGQRHHGEGYQWRIALCREPGNAVNAQFQGPQTTCLEALDSRSQITRTNTFVDALDHPLEPGDRATTWARAPTAVSGRMCRDERSSVLRYFARAGIDQRCREHGKAITGRV
jgi:hypothetical protein